MWGGLSKCLLIFCFHFGNTNTIRDSETEADSLERSSLTGFNLLEQIPGEPFSPIDFQNAESLMDTSPPEGERDPIELANLYEGDILLTNLQWQQFIQSKDSDRNAIIQDSKKWVGGVIPYMISSKFSTNERSIIAKAFVEYHTKTCIKFRPRGNEKDYIFIVKGRGCSAPVGRQGGVQPVTLGDGCVYPGIAIHELMHAAGFWHEQSRDERDDHININFKNISPGMEFNFKKQDNIQNLSVPYDTSSILHYGPYAFAKDRRYPTIVPKIPNKRLGQREALSQNDILKIKRLYNCDGEADKLKTTTTTTTTTEASTTVTSTATTMYTTEMLQSQAPYTTAIAAGAASCEDNHKYCHEWSNRGQCSENSAWMSINCKRSCDRCDAPCKDHNTHCSTWASKGECLSNPEYMGVYCAQSCNKCENASATTESSLPNMTSPNCQDEDPHCGKWSDSGECMRNPEWMVEHCPKSCKLCF